MAGVPALMAAKHCILAASESVGGGTIHLRELGYAIQSSGPLAQVYHVCLRTPPDRYQTSILRLRE